MPNELGIFDSPGARARTASFFRRREQAVETLTPLAVEGLESAAQSADQTLTQLSAAGRPSRRRVQEAFRERRPAFTPSPTAGLGPATTLQPPETPGSVLRDGILVAPPSPPPPTPPLTGGGGPFAGFDIGAIPGAFAEAARLTGGGLSGVVTNLPTTVMGDESGVGIVPFLEREVEFFRPVTEPVGRLLGRGAVESRFGSQARAIEQLGGPDIAGIAEDIGGAVLPELAVPSNLIPIPIIDDVFRALPIAARLLSREARMATRAELRQLADQVLTFARRNPAVKQQADTLVADLQRQLTPEVQVSEAPVPQFGAAPQPSRIRALAAEPVEDVLSGEPADMVTLFRGLAREGDELFAGAHLTPNRADAELFARTDALETGGVARVVEVSVRRDALRPLGPESELAASRGAVRLGDPGQARVVEAGAAAVPPGAPPTLGTVADTAERAALGDLPAVGGGAPTGIPSPRVLKTIDEIAQDAVRSTQNAAGALARRASRFPPLRTLVDFINPSALIERPPATLVRELGQEGATQLQARLVAHGRLMDQGSAMASAIEEGIQQRARTVGLDVQDGLVVNVEGSPPVGDLFENPSRYTLTRQQRGLVDEVQVVLNDMNAVEKAAGVKKGEIFSGEGRYFPRQVREIRGVENVRAEVRRIVGGKQGFSRERFYETMQEGMDAGVRYADDIGAVVGTRIRAGLKASGDEGLAQLLRPLGRTLKAPKTTPGIGELGTMVPALGGRAFPPQTARAIMDALNPAPPGSTLRFLDGLNNLLRPIQATGELSFWGIQMMSSIFRNPAAFAKGALYSLDGLLLDGRLYGRFIQNNAPWIERFMRANGVWNSSEFTFEQAVKNKTIRTVFEKVGLKGAAGRFDQAFNQGLNITALENFKGMVGLGDSVGFDKLNRVIRGALGDFAGDTVDEVAASVASKMTGRVPVRGLGVKATQRSVESSVAFASRYYRAMFGLLGDAVQGGMRGAEARRVLGSLFAGAMVAHVAAARALGQEPNLDPRNSKWLTVEIGGIRVGVGGPIYGLGRMLAESVENPDKLKSFSMDNPLVRWARGRTAPVLSLATDLVTQETFLGKKIDSVGDLFREIATTPLPFIAQQTIEEGPEAFAPQFFGLRAFPSPKFDQFKEAFKAETGRDYDSTEASRRVAEASATLRPMLAEIDAEARERGSAVAIEREERAGVLAQLAESMAPLIVGVRAGTPEAGPRLREEYSTFKAQAFALALRDSLGVDFPEPDSDLGRLVQQYYEVEMARDPETLQPQFAAFDAERDAILKEIEGLAPDVAAALQTRFRLPEEARDVERQLQQVAELRNQLGDIPQFRGISVEAKRNIDGFLRQIRTAIDQAKDQVGPDNVLSVQDAIRQVGQNQGRSEAFITAALALNSTSARRRLLNPDYVKFVVDNADELLYFYPALRSDVVSELLSRR